MRADVVEPSAADLRSCWLACSRVWARRIRRDRGGRSRPRGVTAEDPGVGRRARLGPKGSTADPQADIQIRMDHPRRDCRGGRRDAMGGLPARDAGGMRTGTAPRRAGLRGFPTSPTRPAGRDAIPLQLRHVRSGDPCRHRRAGGGNLQIPAGPYRPCSSAAQRANTPPRRRDHQEAPTSALPRRRPPGSLTAPPLDGPAAPLRAVLPGPQAHDPFAHAHRQLKQFFVHKERRCRDRAIESAASCGRELPWPTARASTAWGSSSVRRQHPTPGRRVAATTTALTVAGLGKQCLLPVCQGFGRCCCGVSREGASRVRVADAMTRRRALRRGR
jgi:hypothetical protein